MASILSAASLGGEARVEKKTYTRNKIHVTQLSGQRSDRNKRFRVCVIPWAQKWHPSKTANFVFDDHTADPEFLFKLAQPEWNPSVWVRRNDKKKRLAIRVPKDRSKELWVKLYRQGFWYSPATNRWYVRKRRSRKSGYPNFVRPLKVQKGKKKFTFKKAA